MGSSERTQNISRHQQRILTLLFKFRFVSAKALAQVLGIRKEGAYQRLEKLVQKELVIRVYDSRWRIDRKPAYYYLSKTGVTAVRKILNASESLVHTLYANDTATDEFVDHCLALLDCYLAIAPHQPAGSEIFSKTEINRFEQFPRNRPDMYIRTPSRKEAMVAILHDVPLYIARKRLEEIITHSEEEGWTKEAYPAVYLILNTMSDTRSLLTRAKHILDNLGIDDAELIIRAAPIASLQSDTAESWYAPRDLTVPLALLDE